MTDVPDDDRQWNDDQWLVAYVAGELSPADEVRFEARLAAEPALARRVEQHERTELLGTLAARARPGAGKVRRGPLPAMMLLLAAACLVAGALWWRSAEVLSCDARAVATLEPQDAMAYAATVGLPANVVVEGSESRGAGTTARVLPVGAFLEQLAAAEAQRDAALFAAPQAPLEGGFVTVRFTADVECSAVVVLAREGRLQRAYPAAGAFVFAATENRFAPGPVHVLPRPVLVANAIGGLNLHPGFDLGPATAGRRTLVLALREAPVGDELLGALDERLAGGDAAAVRAWLAQQGFVLRAIDIGS